MELEIAGLIGSALLIGAYYLGRSAGRMDVAIEVMKAEVQLLAQVNETLDKAIEEAKEET